MSEITSATFTKSDFLNADKLSKKLGIPVEEIEQALQKHYRARTKIKFKYNNTSTRTIEMVYQAKWNHRTVKNQALKLVLHPMALEQFTQIISKGK